MYEKDVYINSLSQILTERDGQIKNVESDLNMIKNSRVRKLAEFFRRLVYQKILGPFPLLQISALTISRAGFSVYYHTVKRRLKHYSWRFNDVPSASETAPLKTMEARTYVRLSDFQMKADREVIRKKLRAINEEIEKKRGV